MHSLRDSLLIYNSSDCQHLGLTMVHSCQDLAAPLPELCTRSGKLSVMANSAWVCFSFLFLLIFVMPAATYAPAVKLEEVTNLTTSEGKMVSANEPQNLQDPAIISQISAVALLKLLRRRLSERPNQAISRLFFNHCSVSYTNHLLLLCLPLRPVRPMKPTFL